jgi:hypothetical protein
MKLVDNADEQRTLEELLDASKPHVPADCAHLHWLLFTPFRYDAGTNSRFRRAGRTPGVFYASERIETAVAEIAFWRLLFFAESPGTAWPLNPLTFSAFSVRYQANLYLDLTQPPHDERTAAWTEPMDYTACHEIAEEARALGCEAVQSVSARCPKMGINVSLLSCAAFADSKPARYQTWHVKLSGKGIYARLDGATASLQFDRTAFARDPRIARLVWLR